MKKLKRKNKIFQNIGKMLNREDLVYKTNKFTYIFWEFKIYNVFAKSIFPDKNPWDNADTNYKSNWFITLTWQTKKKTKWKIMYSRKHECILWKYRNGFNSFKHGIFPIVVVLHT